MSDQQTITAQIFRFDPATDASPRYETVVVPYEKDMRVLDVLDHAVENHGLEVGYRWFCGVKRCGMCGVSVNGKPALACWEKATPELKIDPLPNMKVVRDLVVDRTRYEEATLALDPVIERHESYQGFPEPLTHTDFADAFKLMNCIECYVCTAACPVLADADGHSFVGPGSLVQLAKVALHPKDRGDRAAAALQGDIYACVSCYQCSNVCPVGINVLEDAIEKLKRRCASEARSEHEVQHAHIFAGVVRDYGRIHPPTLMQRSRGIIDGIAKGFMVLALYWKGKIQLRPRPIPRAEDVARLVDKLEKPQ
ncbi:MAG: 4Fe-4S dicluster domain-containing protein [Hyphomicrobiales bacterium]|nr:4Fe-4S dicluster domain-containing protein [Hyphomicrobiales bacterium]